jgi:hypothetical protein
MCTKSSYEARPPPWRYVASACKVTHSKSLWTNCGTIRVCRSTREVAWTKFVQSTSRTHGISEVTALRHWSGNGPNSQRKQRQKLRRSGQCMSELSTPPSSSRITMRGAWDRVLRWRVCSEVMGATCSIEMHTQKCRRETWREGL